MGCGMPGLPVFHYLLEFAQTPVHLVRDAGSFPGDSDGKESTCNAEDPGLIYGTGRSPGVGNSNPLQYSWLENPMDRGAWQATAYRVIKSQTQLKQLSTRAHTS